MSSLSETEDLEGIAIIGMSGRFPEAPSVQAFWENLKNGRESITYFSRDEARSSGVDEESLQDINYVCASGFLENAEMFDADFFGMTPREAANMDPQQRLFLECCYEALEDAGHSRNEYSDPVGVYAGSNMSYYFLYHLFNPSGVADDFSLALGNDKDYISTRVSYEFNFKGPSINVQTACSTSMTAVATACEGLLNYQCDMALAGGAGIKLPSKSGYLFQEGFIASPDGHTRPFDAEAHGTVFTSTVGVLVLKRLEDALRDKDHIYAVIKGIAVNNDGSDKVGFTAPSREGQAGVISAAQQLAGVAPEDVGFIEAHGTGTSLGDPIEISALEKVFKRNTTKKMFCAVGSVKGNIGHAISGSGVAGMIKGAMALHHKQIPPTINFSFPNAQINFIDSPFYVNNRLSEWESDGRPRVAGVSSFGFGGTNVHAVLCEAPERQPGSRRHIAHLLVLSAKTSGALEKMCSNLAEFLKGNPDIALADVAYTLQTGRKEFEYRRCFLCRDNDEAIKKLSDNENGYAASGRALQNDAYRDKVLALLQDSEADRDSLLSRLADLWVKGAEIDWESLHIKEPANRISLPTYPFERKKHWIEMSRNRGIQPKPNKKTAQSDDPMDWLYTAVWKRQAALPLDSERLRASGGWLVFAEDSGFSDRAIAVLKEQGLSVAAVRPGAGFASAGESTYIIDPACREDYHKLVQTVFGMQEVPGYILHLWNVPHRPDGMSAQEFTERCQQRGFYSLLYLAQALGEKGIEKRLRIAAVTAHMQALSGEEVIYPEKSTILGPCKVIPREYGNLSCQSIDLTVPKAGSLQEKQIIQGLLAEAVSDSPDFISALRGPYRWVQSYEKWNPGNGGPLELAREGGVYLITGGLGGIGLKAAEYMAGKQRIKLALTRRSPFPEKAEWDEWLALHGESDPSSRIIRRLKVIEDSGSEVAVICADVTDREAMRRAVQGIERDLGGISGVIHAAGIADNGPVADKTAEAAQKVLAPKVYGTLVLDDLFRDKALGYMVLFSSSSAVFGNAGFVDYCAANTFLDSYAQHRSSAGEAYTVAIGWDEWDEVGMAADVQRQNRSKAKIPVRDGLRLLDAIVSAGALPQVVVSPGDLNDMLDNVRNFLLKSLNGSMAEEGTVSESNRPELENLYIAPSGETEQIIADIWQKLLGVYPVGVLDNFFELGGHSLLATSLAADLAKAFRCNVSLQSLFERPTVRELAEMFDRNSQASAQSAEDDPDYEEGSL